MPKNISSVSSCLPSSCLSNVSGKKASRDAEVSLAVRVQKTAIELFKDLGVIHTNRVNVDSSITEEWRKQEMLTHTKAFKKRKSRRLTPLKKNWKKVCIRATAASLEQGEALRNFLISKYRDTGASSNDCIEVRPSKVDGLGVFAKRTIRKGEPVIEYTGVLTCAAAIEEEALLTKKTNPYLYNLGEGYKYGKKRKWVVDALKQGNESRFINHSTDHPNLIAVEIFPEKEEVLECPELAKTPHVVLIADRDISESDELFIDYGEAYWKDLGQIPKKVSLQTKRKSENNKVKNAAKKRARSSENQGEASLPSIKLLTEQPLLQPVPPLPAKPPVSQPAPSLPAQPPVSQPALPLPAQPPVSQPALPLPAQPPVSQPPPSLPVQPSATSSDRSGFPPSFPDGFVLNFDHEETLDYIRKNIKRVEQGQYSRREKIEAEAFSSLQKFKEYIKNHIKNVRESGNILELAKVIAHRPFPELWQFLLDQGLDPLSNTCVAKEKMGKEARTLFDRLLSNLARYDVEKMKKMCIAAVKRVLNESPQNSERIERMREIINRAKIFKKSDLISFKTILLNLLV